MQLASDYRAAHGSYIGPAARAVWCAGMAEDIATPKPRPALAPRPYI